MIFKTFCGASSLLGLTVLVALGCRATNTCRDPHAPCLSCDPCADIPSGAVPAPVGSRLCQWHIAQAALADRDQSVIYNYEFLCETADLSPFGQRHLDKITDRVVAGIQPIIHPIVVEPAETPELTQGRVAAVVNHLLAAGIDDAASHVVVDYTIAEGLYGSEASQIGNRFITSGVGQGIGRGGGQRGGGGFGGGGVL